MKVFDLFQKIKSSFNLESGWLPYINEQLKWSFAFFSRVVAISATIIFVILMVKLTGVIKVLKAIASDKQEFGISTKDATVISAPDINYDKDLKDINSVLKMLKGKKAEKEGTKNDKNKPIDEPKATK
jgi:hypothetical protein